MTREHKLALILGFSLVLIVGVLVGDHFSRARKAEVGPEVATPTGAAIQVPRDLGPAPLQPNVLPASFTENQTRLTDEPMTGPSGTGSGAARAETKTREVPELAMGKAPPAAATESTEIPGFKPANPGWTSPTPPGPNTPGLGEQAPVKPETSQGEPTTTPGTNKSGLPISTGAERRYVIEQGDSLYDLSKKYYNDGSLHKKLAEYNKLASNALRVGVTIRIPPKDVLLGKAALAPEGTKVTDPLNGKNDKPASKNDKPGINDKPGLNDKNNPATKPTQLVKNEPAKPTLAGPNGANKPTERVYVVKAGDTLGKIAAANLGTSKRWQEILDLNRKTIQAEEDLQVGMSLRLPAK